MLIQFRFENFRSFRDEAELSFRTATRYRDNERLGLFRPKGYSHDLLSVLGIFGANASGKTNVVKALRFVNSAVSDSYRRWSPEGPCEVEPFKLIPDGSRKPSVFQLDLLLGGIPVQYGFGMTREKVTKEWCYSWPKGRRQTLFERTGPKEFRFGRELKGPNDTISSITRSNSLFLSTAAQNSHEQLQPLYSWITSKIRYLSPEDEKPRLDYTTQLLAKEHSEKIINLIKLADLGIADLKVKKKELISPPKLPEPALEAFNNFITILKDSAGEKDKDGNMNDPFGSFVVPELTFAHATSESKDPVIFRASDESRGTISWAALAGPLIQAIDDGALLLADELDSSLHELLQAEAISLFNDNSRNANGGQLVFTSHDTTVLGDAIPAHGWPGRALLRRDQIWFAEKDREGASVLTPLSDFKVRKEDNLQRWYLSGRYGGVPFIDRRFDLTDKMGRKSESSTDGEK